MIEVLEEKLNKAKILEKEDNIATSLLKNLNNLDDYSDFLILVLKVKYKTDFTKLDMYGLDALSYIKNATSKIETKIVDFNLDDDIIKVVKQNLNDKKYVLVLYSDTPLIKRRTVLEILDYFRIKKLCALKFNRGYAFESDYLKSVEKIYNPQIQSFEEEDFLKVCDEKSFCEVLNVLKTRILTYHMSSGVIIKHPDSTFVDAEVNIDSGVIIENNVIIKGKTIIKSDVKIGSNVCINNAIIEKNCEINNCVIENSVILEKSKICDFSVIKNASIKENSYVSNEKITL